MASIKDIASELGIGVSTVSMALNGNEKISKKTRELVKETAEKMNYVKNGIAVDLQRKRTNTILLVVEDAGRSYFSKFIGEFQKYISQYNYDLLIATTYKGNTTTALRYISEKRVDGVVVFTNKILDEVLTRYSSKNFPIVALNRQLSGESLYSVIMENKEGGRKITKYLIEKGHKKIAFIKGDSKTIGAMLRYEGFDECINSNGIADKCTFIDAKETTENAGYNATLEVIKNKVDVDAIFYSSDELALGGIRALNEVKINIPEEISVVGYNDLELSKYTKPPLTTVKADINMAAEAAKLIVKALENDTIKDKIVRGGTTIVVRDSVRRRE